MGAPGLSDSSTWSTGTSTEAICSDQAFRRPVSACARSRTVSVHGPFEPCARSVASAGTAAAS
jgi:hypothetical protein